MVTVHRYKLFELASGEWIVQLSKCSEETIKSLGGQTIPGTAEEVEPTVLDPSGRYVPTTNSRS